MHQGVSESGSTFLQVLQRRARQLPVGGFTAQTSKERQRGRGRGDRGCPGLQGLGLRWDQAAGLLKGGTASAPDVLGGSGHQREAAMRVRGPKGPQVQRKAGPPRGWGPGGGVGAGQRSSDAAVRLQHTEAKVLQARSGSEHQGSTGWAQRELRDLKARRENDQGGGRGWRLLRSSTGRG